MGFSIQYKRLFEVRILHGYFLDMGSEKNFFELDEGLSSEAAFKKAALRRYDLSNAELEVMPTESCQKILNNHGMVFRVTPTGFFVGVKVKEEQQSGNTVHRPVIELDNGLTFQFRIKLKNRNWSNFSSVRMRPNVPSCFYLTNHQSTNQLGPPSLALDAGVRYFRYYEMGERVIDSSNNLFEAIRGVPSSEPLLDGFYWRAIEDYRYISYQDQRLLPSRFTYRFITDDGQGVSNASFVLSDSSNPNIAQIDTTAGTPIQEYALDWRRQEIPSGDYTLSVESSGGYQDEKAITIDDDLYGQDQLALVSIAHQEGLPNDLKLLEDDGTLHRVGDAAQHPVFEVRVKARHTYWRYILHPLQGNSNLLPGGDIEEVDGRLVTTGPRPLTISGSKVSDANDVLLPSPSNLHVTASRQDSGQKYYSDIFLEQL